MFKHSHLEHSVNYVHVITYGWDQTACPMSLFPDVLKLSLDSVFSPSGGSLIPEFDMSLLLARERKEGL